MSTPVVQYTKAGLAELISAKNQGIKGAITWIAAGDRSYTPSVEQTRLYNEKQRELISDWEELSDTQMRMCAVFRGDLEYEVREVGFYLESGTLLAVYSVPNTLLAYKSANASWLQKFTLDISPLPTGSITIVNSIDNVNILMLEELLTSSVAFVNTQSTQVRICHQQMKLSEKLRMSGV